jgi:hypothetical protein
VYKGVILVQVSFIITMMHIDKEVTENVSGRVLGVCANNRIVTKQIFLRISVRKLESTG